MGTIPSIPKMIVIGAPHTSNWDFVIFLAALHHYRVKVRYLGKHTLFRWPFGGFFEKHGGIPVDRSSPGGVVDQAVAAIEATSEIVLVIAPEGTRRQTRYWRSGFLKIAETAGIPVVFAGVDYRTRTVTIGGATAFDGDVTRFMDTARSFYQDKRGFRPELETPVILREELERS